MLAGVVVRKSRAHVFRRSIALISLAVIISVVSSIVSRPAAAQTEPTVTALNPTVNATINGKTTFQFRVDNIASDGYIPFWAVDNGEWNRISQDPQRPNIASVEVDLSGWNWRSDHNYTLSFIALQKSNWQPVIIYVPITIGDKPAQPVLRQVQAMLPVVPTTGKTLYADPTSTIASQATSWAQSHPENAKLMDYLRSAAIARWFGGWNGNVQADVDAYVSRAHAAGGVPVIVAYNIPNRDCGSYSAGGASDAAAYNAWVGALAAGIGTRDALVVLEPDALANMDCLSNAGQAERLQLLHTAITTLKTRSSARVYVDAGNITWHPATETAKRLTNVGVRDADGFSLNVSNFETTADNIAYGKKVSALTNGAHFVIDTSRNGNGATATNTWCNPSGRAVGELPTLTTNTPLVDAFLWIKPPGESDGTCGADQAGTSAPAAGQWWPQYALSLLSNVRL